MGARHRGDRAERLVGGRVWVWVRVGVEIGVGVGVGVRAGARVGFRVRVRVRVRPRRLWGTHPRRRMCRRRGCA